MKRSVQIALVVFALLPAVLAQSSAERDEACRLALSGYENSTKSDLEMPSDLNNIQLQYSENGCYGKCPVFTMEVSRNQITFHGVKYVHSKGKKKARLKAGEFEGIVRAWFEGRFYAMRDDYCEMKCPDGTSKLITDVPSYDVKMTSPGLSKSVYSCAAYLNGKPELPVPPDAFRDFQARMRTLAKSHAWL